MVSTPLVARRGDGSSRHADQIAHRGQLGLADAGYLKQIFDFAERTVGSPECFDSLGQNGSETWGMVKPHPIDQVKSAAGNVSDQNLTGLDRPRNREYVGSIGTKQ